MHYLSIEDTETDPVEAIKQRERAAAERARADALEEAAKIARNGCLVPPDGGSPTSAETELCDEIARRIRALAQPPAQEPGA